MNIQIKKWQRIWNVPNTKLKRIKRDIFDISVNDKIIVTCRRIGKIETIILYNWYNLSAKWECF